MTDNQNIKDSPELLELKQAAEQLPPELLVRLTDIATGMILHAEGRASA